MTKRIRATLWLPGLCRQTIECEIAGAVVEAAGDHTRLISADGEAYDIFGSFEAVQAIASRLAIKHMLMILRDDLTTADDATTILDLTGLAPPDPILPRTEGVS